VSDTPHFYRLGPPLVAGANAFLTVRSYLSTARKHHIGYLRAQTTLYTAHPWLPTATP
jgi:hypothetical protein